MAYVWCRTGLTALTVSLWFFVSLFFGPILCECLCPSQSLLVFHVSYSPLRMASPWALIAITGRPLK